MTLDAISIHLDDPLSDTLVSLASYHKGASEQQGKRCSITYGSLLADSGKKPGGPREPRHERGPRNDYVHHEGKKRLGCLCRMVSEFW